MTTTYVAFRSSDDLHQTTDGFIQRMRDGASKPEPKVVEKIMSFDEFHDADEIFLSGNMSKVTPVRILDCDEAVVRRMLNPRHKSKIWPIEAALAALGKRLVVGVHDAA